MPDRLTSRELQVGRLLAEGKTFEEIADALTLAPSTVRSHALTLRLKLRVQKSRQIPHALRQRGYLK